MAVQVRHLSCLSFDDIKKKFADRVTAETFENSLSSLHPSPTDVCPLYLGLATVAALPLKCSRYNSSSRSHAITKLVKSHKTGVNETIVVSVIFKCPTKTRRSHLIVYMQDDNINRFLCPRL